jgi:DNA-binding winged helix-turn-helix (wHTH) protein
MRRGQSVEVQRFTFDLLAFFMRNPGRAIAKGELLVSVWGTMHRSDTVVARAVMKLRDAIGDDGSEPRIVKTIHRYGYRWDEPVRVELVNSAARPALDERSNRLTDDGGA